MKKICDRCGQRLEKERVRNTLAVCQRCQKKRAREYELTRHLKNKSV